MAAYYKVDVSLSTNSVTVGAPSPQEVIVTLPLVGPAGAVGATGATGATGPAGSGIEILTTQGDLLYRGASEGERLPIGTSGQVLKVSGGIPAWGAESGAVSSVAGRTGAITLAVADVANAVSTSDSRLTDTRTPSSTLAHASSHHTGGTDALTARSIGGLAVATRTEVTYSASLTLPAARHTELVVSNTNAAGITLNLPPAADGTLVGDTYSIVGGPTVAGTITIVSIGTFFTFTLATITAVGQRFTARAGSSSGQGSWELVTVDKHGHVAADITGLPAASTTTPAALGTAAVGTGTTFARADHVHAMPTAANVGAAQAVTDIELTPDGTTTVTTAQLPARGIAFSDGEATFTVNLPTPDIRQSGLTFSIKSQYEAASGPNFITVVHDSVNLLTTSELDEAEGSIDFLWDGYAWTYSNAYRLRSFPNRVLQLPNASGTIALTSDFAAPPAIGNTTPAAGAFTTLAATATLHTFGVSNPASDTTIQFYGAGAANRLHRMLASAAQGMVFSTGATATFGPCMQNGGNLRLAALGTIRWGNNNNNPAAGGESIELARDADDTLALRRSTAAQTLNVYGTYTSATNFQRLTIKTRAVTLSGLTGASVATTTGLIPDGAVLVGLTTRVSTAITGATGYDIGDGSDADRWGANVAIALNTSSDNTNWTAGTIECFTAAQEVTLTAVGSNFTGGAVVIVAHYLAGEAD